MHNVCHTFYHTTLKINLVSVCADAPAIAVSNSTNNFVATQKYYDGTGGTTQGTVTVTCISSYEMSLNVYSAVINCTKLGWDVTNVRNCTLGQHWSLIRN
jgi:hypothetical protein